MTSFELRSHSVSTEYLVSSTQKDATCRAPRSSGDRGRFGSRYQLLNTKYILLCTDGAR